MLKICGKDYVVPELNFTHAEILENESGMRLYDVVFGNSTMTAARAFVQVVTGADSATAKAMLDKHLTEGGYKAFGEIMDVFVAAVFDSDFFCAILGLPNKAEREAQEKAKREALEKESQSET